jgi:hypothetical protein
MSPALFVEFSMADILEADSLQLFSNMALYTVCKVANAFDHILCVLSFLRTESNGSVEFM